VVDVAGTITLRIGSHDLAVDPCVLRREPSIARLAGRAIALGFRADALRRDPDGPLDLDVLATTLTAHEQFVELEIDAPGVTQGADGVHVADDRSSTIIMTVRADDTLSLWQPCRVGVDTTRLHFFDLDTGDRIVR
jgi:hypothetical protein